jgi:hypothetical protein
MLAIGAIGTTGSASALITGLGTDGSGAGGCGGSIGGGTSIGALAVGSGKGVGVGVAVPVEVVVEVVVSPGLAVGSGSTAVATSATFTTALTRSWLGPVLPVASAKLFARIVTETSAAAWHPEMVKVNCWFANVVAEKKHPSPLRVGCCVVLFMATLSLAVAVKTRDPLASVTGMASKSICGAVRSIVVKSLAIP